MTGMDDTDEFDTLMWRSAVGGTRDLADRREALQKIEDIASAPREGTWLLPWDARDDVTVLGETAARYICGGSLSWCHSDAGTGLRWLSTQTALVYSLERQGRWWAIRTTALSNSAD